MIHYMQSTLIYENIGIEKTHLQFSALGPDKVEMTCSYMMIHWL